MIEPLQMGAAPSFFKEEDFQGNNGLGRYVILCGSPGRIKDIASSLKNVRHRPHPRGFDLTLADYPQELGAPILIALICTGIGCPSLDSVFHHLVASGARRFLRIGTCGSLQPGSIRTGSIVVAEAAVRDEGCSGNYVFPSYPAYADLTWAYAARMVAEKSEFRDSIYHGIVHTKDSLVAREFKRSILHSNREFMQELKLAGVIASDMETSHFYVMKSLLSYQSTEAYSDLSRAVKALSILAVVGDDQPFSDDLNAVRSAEQRAVEFGMKIIRYLFESESEVAR